MTLIFVYGTLMRNERNAYVLTHYLGATFLGTAYASGVLYNLGRYPGARFDEPGVIPGELYQIPEASLPQLDRFESTPTLYTRRQVPVRTAFRGGPETVEAWAYQIVNVKPDNPKIPSWPPTQ